MSRGDVEELAGSLGQPLMRLAYVLTGDPDEAQDVVQAVFLKLLTVDLDDVQDLRAYARRAVANEVTSRGRRLTLFRKSLPKLVDPSMLVAGTQSPATEAVADRQQLLQALARLTARQRTVLVLRYFEDYDDQVIGEVIGCSPATVRSIAARSLAKLRIRMGADPKHGKEDHEDHL